MNPENKEGVAMKNRNCRKLLISRQVGVNSLLGVGLDPLIEKLPACVMVACTSVWSAVLLWMMGIVDKTAPFACMFKAQHAHWSAIPGGLEALQALVAYIHLKYPDIPVFIDCKRGDIDRTQRQYREAHFTLEGADGMNYNGYMGRDTLKSLVDPENVGRALVGLGRTSNPDAWVVQDRKGEDGLTSWEYMLVCLWHWSEELGVLENAGVVMGAAYKDPNDPSKVYSRHLSRAREIVGDSMWFLIPAIGTQGGLVEETIAGAFVGPGSVVLSDSSSIDFASSGPDYAEAAGRKAEERRDQIRAAGGNC